MKQLCKIMLGYIWNLRGFQSAIEQLEVRVERPDGTGGTGNLQYNEAGKAVLIIKLNS